MSLEQQLAEILKGTSGLKGQEIAEKLHLDVDTVNACLRQFRGKLFYQESGAYRWRVKDPSVGKAAPGKATPVPLQTDLAKLCRYYLDCISLERDLDISANAKEGLGHDFVELSAMPIVTKDVNVFETDDAKRLLNKIRGTAVGRSSISAIRCAFGIWKTRTAGRGSRLSRCAFGPIKNFRTIPVNCLTLPTMPQFSTTQS